MIGVGEDDRLTRRQDHFQRRRAQAVGESGVPGG